VGRLGRCRASGGAGGGPAGKTWAVRKPSAAQVYFSMGGFKPLVVVDDTGWSCRRGRAARAACESSSLWVRSSKPSAVPESVHGPSPHFRDGSALNRTQSRITRRRVGARGKRVARASARGATGTASSPPVLGAPADGVFVRQRILPARVSYISPNRRPATRESASPQSLSGALRGDRGIKRMASRGNRWGGSGAVMLPPLRDGVVAGGTLGFSPLAKWDQGGSGRHSS